MSAEGPAERSYSMFKVRRGGHEEIPLVQGKEQWLCFAGAAVSQAILPFMSSRSPCGACHYRRLRAGAQGLVVWVQKLFRGSH